MSFERFDIVVVPFPFTDKTTVKRRPALVLSSKVNFNQKVGQSVLAMITSAQNSDWPLDTDITNLDAAGLPSASIVRMKLFTLDDQLIIRKAGSLCATDQKQIVKALHDLFKLKIPAGYKPAETK